jgi:hypothetical protein
MDDADIVRDELGRYFASNLAAMTAAAWKRAAARALAVAEAGRDRQPEVDRVNTMRRWALAQGHWSRTRIYRPRSR